MISNDFEIGTHGEDSLIKQSYEEKKKMLRLLVVNTYLVIILVQAEGSVLYLHFPTLSS